jgi:hypothetical protein
MTRLDSSAVAPLAVHAALAQSVERFTRNE